MDVELVARFMIRCAEELSCFWVCLSIDLGDSCFLLPVSAVVLDYFFMPKKSASSDYCFFTAVSIRDPLAMISLTLRFRFFYSRYQLWSTSYTRLSTSMAWSFASDLPGSVTLRSMRGITACIFRTRVTFFWCRRS